MSDMVSRPDLLIFVDKAGEDIHEQFNSIMQTAGIAPSLQKNLGLVLYSSTRKSANHELFNQQLLMSAQSNHSTNELAQAIEHILEILGEETKSRSTEVNKTDSPTSEKLPRIYLIGNVNSVSIGETLKTVRTCLLKLNADMKKVEIYYVLSGSSESPSGDNSSPSQQALTVLDWEKREIVNYCYLFPTEHLSEKEVYFEVARVLFVLVATHIVSHHEFEQIMSIERKQGNLPFGILNTGLISVSNENLSNYDLHQLGDDLSEKWIAAPVNSTFNNEKAQLVKKTRDGIHERVREIRKSMPEDDKKISEIFSLKSVTKLYRERNKQQIPDNWVTFLSGEAENQYEEWTKKKKTEFETAKNIIQKKFEDTMDDAKQPDNMLSAKVSVEALGEEMNEYYKKEVAIIPEPSAREALEKKVKEKEETVSQLLERSPSRFSLGVLVFLALSILIFLILTSFSPFAEAFQAISFFGGAIVAAAFPAMFFFWWHRRKLVTAQDAFLHVYSDYYTQLRLSYIGEQKRLIIESLQDELKRMPEHLYEIAEVTMWIEKSLDQAIEFQSAIVRPSRVFIRKANQEDFDWERIYTQHIPGSGRSLAALVDASDKKKILVAALFPSNSPTGIKIDALFPLKKAPGSAL